jgi:hypothetical protein
MGLGLGRPPLPGRRRPLPHLRVPSSPKPPPAPPAAAMRPRCGSWRRCPLRRPAPPPPTPAQGRRGRVGPPPASAAPPASPSHTPPVSHLPRLTPRHIPPTSRSPVERITSSSLQPQGPAARCGGGGRWDGAPSRLRHAHVCRPPAPSRLCSAPAMPSRQPAHLPGRVPLASGSTCFTCGPRTADTRTRATHSTPHTHVAYLWPPPDLRREPQHPLLHPLCAPQYLQGVPRPPSCPPALSMPLPSPARTRRAPAAPPAAWRRPRAAAQLAAPAGAPPLRRDTSARQSRAGGGGRG